MRWLVTGGAGFIGSYVVDAILKRNLGDVVVLDNFRRGRLEYLSQHDGDTRLSIIRGDIRDPAVLAEACEGADHVLHLAARSNVMGSESDAQEACETNVTGTLNVLDAALRAGVRSLVFSSSREVYGDPQNLPVAETDPVAPKNLYGASKAAGELYCSIYRQRGLDIRVLRLANAYGPRDTERVIPLWLDRAAAGEPLLVYGGKQVLDLIWIDFVVDALLQAAFSTSFKGPVNVGSGQGVPILKLAEQIIAQTGSTSQLEMLPARDQEVVGFVAEVRQMKSQLGITPPHEPLAYLPTMIARMATGARPK